MNLLESREGMVPGQRQRIAPRAGTGAGELANPARALHQALQPFPIRSRARPGLVTSKLGPACTERGMFKVKGRLVHRVAVGRATSTPGWQPVGEGDLQAWVTGSGVGVRGLGPKHAWE